MNGTVVAIDPSNGRILAMVNQKLALSSGAEPCSTIKVSVALAALSEGIVTKDTPVDLGGWKVDMNQALAHSNNQYFEALGRRLGFQKVSYYAHQFGLGELAGWNIEGEHLGVYPSEELPAKLGGVGKMCSFGESISMTPLQLGSLMAAIANGGTLYYLQHPRSAVEVTNFQPKVKRYLDIAPLIPKSAWACWVQPNTVPREACAPTSPRSRSWARPEPAATPELASAGSVRSPTPSPAASSP